MDQVDDYGEEILNKLNEIKDNYSEFKDSFDKNILNLKKTALIFHNLLNKSKTDNYKKFYKIKECSVVLSRLEDTEDGGLKRKIESQSDFIKRRKTNGNLETLVDTFLNDYYDSSVYKSIKKDDYSIQDRERELFLKIFQANVLKICGLIKEKRFINKIDEDLIDDKTFSMLHPILYDYYLPHVTTGDGNCLFNMISLCLVGNESLKSLLRALTVFTMIKFQNEFLNIISKEVQFESLEDGLIMKKYYEKLFEAKEDGKWGNEIHLLSISTFLSSNIIVYGSFWDNKDLLNKANTINELQNAFNKGIRTGSHLIYKPIKNEIFRKEEELIPLFGFFSPTREHYSAIIPTRRKIPIFNPKNCLYDLDCLKGDN
jgi:hypothetical protein